MWMIKSVYFRQHLTVCLSSLHLSSLGPNRIEVPTVSRTTTSISLSWRKPPGDVFKYKVEWNNGGSQMVNFIQNNSTLLSDLIPGTRYTIAITAVAGDNTTGEPQIFTEVTSNPHFLHVTSPCARNCSKNQHAYF